jgi:hypothetical protein
MASSATMALAEARAYAKVKDGTWVNAFACRQIDGTIAVRVQRRMSPTSPDAGGWVEIADDATD